MEVIHVIYLDYSATTPVDESVLNVFIESTRKYFVNPNSAYPEAVIVKNLIDGAGERIRSHLHLPSHEVVYTSGATEANNLAIKGLAFKRKDIGKHLIMSPFEHSSVTACFGYLQKQGYLVDVVNTLPDGSVDLDDLASLMRNDTILVSICGVASEIGILQPIEEIARIVHQYPNAIFHSDMTQAIGKTAVRLEQIDLITLSAHKIYGIKGIGALLRRESVKLNQMIHGGKSTTAIRSGTPALPLILSLEKALDMITSDLPKNYLHVKKLHQRLADGLMNIEGCFINSPLNSIPHIINVSVLTILANDMQKYLSDHGIVVSTQTACASGEVRSEAVYRLTKSEAKARSSVRISLSHQTTEAEIDQLVKAIKAVSA
jgi:cysteine desulfurase